MGMVWQIRFDWIGVIDLKNAHKESVGLNQIVYFIERIYIKC